NLERQLESIHGIVPLERRKSKLGRSASRATDHGGRMSVVNESEGEMSYESDGSETDSTRTDLRIHNLLYVIVELQQPQPSAFAGPAYGSILGSSLGKALRRWLPTQAANQYPHRVLQPHCGEEIGTLTPPGRSGDAA
ncbi:hypothetical protein BIW11_14280, partial [Tropilaelaps mercedesae]